MKYKIEVEKRARKFIEKQPLDKRTTILRAIYRLPDGDTKTVKGHDGLFRLRVGTYRILYRIDNGACIICVIDAGNRGQVYNRI